jgi:hypothetical protein
MSFDLKNRTSTVPVERTIARIEQALAKAGASTVVKEYGPKADVAALTFTIELGTDGAFTVRLPVNTRAIADRMLANRVAKNRGRRTRGAITRDNFMPQAERTAWKLMQDWVEVQLSLIAMQQADFLAVFLPYVYDGSSRMTFYERIQRGGARKMLTG